MLKFSPAKDNAKLRGKKMYTFSLPSGHTCPSAKDCNSRVIDGKIKDGKHTIFRCFSASQEVIYPSVRRQREHNLAVLRDIYANSGISGVIAAIEKSVKTLKKCDFIRIHVGGDFFTKWYFEAWLAVAKNCPQITFYAYTKSLKFWVSNLANIPSNFVLTASFGGHTDELISKHNLRYVKVVYHPSEALNLGLEIDHDDSHAMTNGDNFALLIHGVQPKNSAASSAISLMKKSNISFSYS